MRWVGLQHVASPGTEARAAEAQPHASAIGLGGQTTGFSAVSTPALTPCERRPGANQGALCTSSLGRSAPLATPQQREAAEAEQRQGGRLGDDGGPSHVEAVQDDRWRAKVVDLVELNHDIIDAIGLEQEFEGPMF